MIVKKMIIILAVIIMQNSSAYEELTENNCEVKNEVYVFSWPLSNDCDDKPRGGTSKGANIIYDDKPHQLWQDIQNKGTNKFTKDRLAILAMQGAYRVDFNFLETVGFSEDYKRDKPYHSWGTEYVYLVENKEKFISLQHIMVMYITMEDGSVSDPFVMKHWRQDWTYEDNSLLEYQGHNTWKKRKVKSKDRKGKWSQAVFQVDDSPRYESMGFWQHNDSFSTWISEKTSRPLPRREYSIRKDYQVLEGFNRHTIHRFGWVQEEENWKKVLDDDKNTYIAKEEGMGRYRKITGTDFTPGDEYWQATGQFWADVRQAWQDVINQNDVLSLHKKVDGQSLFMPMFSYASEVQKSGDYDRNKGIKFIKKTLNQYINKGQE